MSVGDRGFLTLPWTWRTPGERAQGAPGGGCARAGCTCYNYYYDYNNYCDYYNYYYYL